MSGDRASRPLEAEIMDGPLSYREAERALGDLDRVNRRLLGNRPAVACLAPRLAATAGEADRPPRLLDVGTGSGRTAAAIVRAAERRGGERAVVVGVDRRLAHLVVGRRAGVEQLRVVASAEALPFRDDAFDWACQTLFFHHFDGPDNRSILAEAGRVTRRGVAVIDLVRSRLAAVLVRLLFPLLGVGRVAFHDGLLSLAQAWRPREVAQVLDAPPGGLAVTELRRRFPFRWSLVLEPRSRPAPPR